MSSKRDAATLAAIQQTLSHRPGPSAQTQRVLRGIRLAATGRDDPSLGDIADQLNAATNGGKRWSASDATAGTSQDDGPDADAKVAELLPLLKSQGIILPAGTTAANFLDRLHVSLLTKQSHEKSQYGDDVDGNAAPIAMSADEWNAMRWLGR